MSSNVIMFPRKEQTTRQCVDKVPSYCRKLAASLTSVLNIQNGNELVRLIGNGDEYSNQRAIESWIQNNYSEVDVGTMESPLKELGKALNDEIQRCLF